jgi:hypothetical protein
VTVGNLVHGLISTCCVSFAFKISFKYTFTVLVCVRNILLCTELKTEVAERNQEMQFIGSLIAT